MYSCLLCVRRAQIYDFFAKNTVIMLAFVDIGYSYVPKSLIFVAKFNDYEEIFNACTTCRANGWLRK